MSHPTRPVRRTFALVGVAGVLALSGCAATTDAADTDASTAPSTEASTQASAEATAAPSAEATADAGAGAATSVYADGTYSASGAYQTPETVEEIEVSITLEGDIITAVEVTGEPAARESEQYQGQFIGGISDAVVGKNIDEISVDKVAGSSLTSGGFNQALEAIRSEAAA